VTLGTVSVVVI
jgi:hypothetical protein